MSTELDNSPETDDGSPLANLRIAFVGKLGGHNRKEARKLVRDHGATPVDINDGHIDLIVIGADELPVDPDNHLDEDKLRLGAEGKLEIIGETQLWQRIGLLESENNIRRLYTPAMLAQLLDVSVANIRRWYRRGLIVPAKEINKLPYFDFQEISVARQLAQLVAAGASVASIESKLAQLSQFWPDAERPLTQLSVLVEGRELLMRQGEGLIDTAGQRRIDFDSLEEETRQESANQTISYVQAEPPDLSESLGDLDEYLELATEYEDSDNPLLAVEVYRAALLAFGPNAEICFRMGEIFALAGQPQASRERYFMAIELDESYIEARANLGCVLLELDQVDLAIAAFEGALDHHAEYPDVHFHLARIFDDRFQSEQAEKHWQKFLDLAPESPWADEARLRLGISTTAHDD